MIADDRVNLRINKLFIKYEYVLNNIHFDLPPRKLPPNILTHETLSELYDKKSNYNPVFLKK